MTGADAGRYLRRVRLERERVPSFDEYPFALPGVRGLDQLELHPKVTYFVGDNGSGKSTLMEAIAVAFGFNAEGGSKNLRFETRPSHSVLHQYLRVEKGLRSRDGFFFRAESWYGLGTAIEQQDLDSGIVGTPIIDAYGGSSLHEQSHGESFQTLFFRRFVGRGLYLLDEPEAALSPTTQLAVLRRIHELVQRDSQFVIATHSPILLAYPDSRIYQLGERGIETIAWADAESVSVSRLFLASPERMLRQVLGDPASE